MKDGAWSSSAAEASTPGGARAEIELGQGAAVTGAGLPCGFELAGRYRIRCELGRGGMGVVYAAQHLALEREVALKTLHPRLLADPDAVSRFTREARAAASIGHPGIVHVFDLGTDRGITFLAMELLHGEDLRQRIKRAGALQIPQVLALGRELSQALAAAHQRGVLHRDLSPGNVFLAVDDFGNERVKVLDFGIAKLVESIFGDGVTDSQQVFGTLMYMAPERVAGAVADPLSDVYAIGALLYEALSGVPPFAACPSPELALKIALDSPPRLRTLRPECPAPLIALVERAMHKEPAQRWTSARALADGLLSLKLELDPASAAPAERTQDAPLAAGRRNRVRKRSWLLLAVASLVVVLASAAALAMRGRLVASSQAPGEQRRAVALARRLELARAAASTATAQPRETGARPSAPVAIAVPPAATRRVRVITHPEGATIEVNGRTLCRAPCDRELPAQASQLLRARLHGYEPAKRRLLVPLPPTVELWLQPNDAVHEPPAAAHAPLPPLLPRR